MSSKYILTLSSAIIILFLGCISNNKNNYHDINTSHIDAKLFSKRIDLDKNIVQVKLSIKSFQDSNEIGKIIIEHPSFLIPISVSATKPFTLMKSEAKSIIFIYNLTRRESFKLKAMVLASSYIGDNLSTNTITYLFYYYNDEQYIVSNDINFILGRKKKNGENIQKEDLRIFNKIENETH